MEEKIMPDWSESLGNLVAVMLVVVVMVMLPMPLVMVFVIFGSKKKNGSGTYD